VRGQREDTGPSVAGEGAGSAAGADWPHVAAVVEWADDAIVATDLCGMIVAWSRGAERLYGYPAREAVGRPVSPIVPPNRADELSRLLAQLREGQRLQGYETQRVRNDGSPVDVSVTVSLVRDPAGNVVGAVEIGREIGGHTGATPRREATEQARLQHLSQAGERKRLEAEYTERLRLDGALLVARTVAHELNNALSPIVGFAELLVDRPAVANDPVAAERVKLLADAAQQLAVRVARLQTITRLAETGSELGPEWSVLDLERSTAP
jgi:PAS domain S-box-containing protein